MATAIPNNTMRVIYYFTKDGKTIEHANLLTLQKMFRQAIDEDFDVTEIKCKTNNTILKV